MHNLGNTNIITCLMNRYFLRFANNLGHESSLRKMSHFSCSFPNGYLLHRCLLYSNHHAAEKAYHESI